MFTHGESEREREKEREGERKKHAKRIADARHREDKSASTRGKPGENTFVSRTWIEQRDAVSKFNRNQRDEVYWSVWGKPSELWWFLAVGKCLASRIDRSIDLIIEGLQFRLSSPLGTMRVSFLIGLYSCATCCETLQESFPCETPPPRLSLLYGKALHLRKIVTLTSAISRFLVLLRLCKIYGLRIEGSKVNI